MSRYEPTLPAQVPVGHILTDVKLGKIALPGLQRPFVWEDSNVRDLLDSMFKGYPIGYIMLWETPDEYENSINIGTGRKKYERPCELVIDGQQRITALLAALCGEEVMGKDYKVRAIPISFKPSQAEFAVCPKDKSRGAEWIDDIVSVFNADENHTLYSFRKNFCDKLDENLAKNGKPRLTDSDRETIEKNIDSLLNLKNYILPVLTISNKVDEESVAEIFVRVNSGGKKLQEKNFIETLLSVYDVDVRSQIEKFCADSRIPADATAYNRHIKLEPSHLIRIAVVLGFKRAKLSLAYKLLVGKDLRTGETSKEIRQNNLRLFKNALNKALNLNDWHCFLNLYSKTGYLDSSFISSDNAVIFSYALYLLAKEEYAVTGRNLDKIIKKWIFMSTITSFYSNSPETEVEVQLADLRNIGNSQGFIDCLSKEINSRFTEDYFNVGLPNDLKTSSVASPEWRGFVASLVVLGTPQFLSTTSTPLSNLMLLGTNGNKKTLEKHHIFPKNYLSSIGITDTRDQNQVANLTYLDYSSNVAISDTSPRIYGKEARTKLGEQEYKDSCDLNAIPYNFYEMSYSEFLEERRKLMAQTIWKAYQVLCK